MTDDRSPDALTEAEEAPGVEGLAARERRGIGLRSRLILLLVAVVFVDIIALFIVPPYPVGQPGEAAGVTDFIEANLEFPEPHVVWAPEGSTQPEGIIVWYPSITNTILTSWLIMAVLVVVAILAGRRRADVPGTFQNFCEWVIEALSGFAESMGGERARGYAAVFMAFFLFILLSNWSGLVPFFRVEAAHYFRAPTSDLNITIGLALVSFFLFHIEGVRNLGGRGYLAKFFPIGAFRHGIGAGAIALFVGLIELMLELVKPVTLSMRLFGNIYGGEVALGVLTALTLAVVPVAMLGLEIMLNFIQALIFSVLTLMFTLAAIEGHHDEEGHAEAMPSEPANVEAALTT